MPKDSTQQELIIDSMNNFIGHENVIHMGINVFVSEPEIT